jgi:hypothetical protein
MSHKTASVRISSLLCKNRIRKQLTESDNPASSIFFALFPSAVVASPVALNPIAEDAVLIVDLR